MRFVVLFLLFLSATAFRSQERFVSGDTRSPLTIFSTEWDKPEYRVCNTAADVSYLSDKEKQIIYILNLARMNPTLFGKTVVLQFPE